MMAKKVPGADWVCLVYDVRDRLVFTQDGNMRSGNKGQWMATLYDDQNRQVMTGMINGYTANRDALQLDVANQTGTNSGVQTVVDGMTINACPLPGGFSFTALTKNYYDKYDWTNKTYSVAYNNLLDAGNNLHPLTPPSLEQKATTGMVTGSQVRVISDPSNLTAGNWLATVNFYDDRNRLLQVNEETLKGTDVITSRYDFSGKIISNYLDHTNSAGSTPFSLRVKTNMEYDHAGRVKEVWKVINDDANKKTLIAKNEYDELGQLAHKQLGHKKDRSDNYTTPVYDPLEILDYSYNIRGWLTGINKDYANGVAAINRQAPWFGMELNYDKGFDINQLNGNIAGTKWCSKGNGERRAYGYTYDKANRLLGANYSQFNGSAYWYFPTIKFDMRMGDGINYYSAYDENGNILAMMQMGLKLQNSEVFDDLHYEYHLDGNKLKSVTDNMPVQTSSGLGDFQDNNTGSNDYGYDVNGNLVTDKNKKLNGVADVDQASGAIVYNHLNLPSLINVDNGNKGTITYVYNAAGNKLQKIALEKGVTVVNIVSDVKTTTNYVGGFVYESKEYLNQALASENYFDKLQFVNHEEGRMRYIIPAPGADPRYEYDYFVKDHLGNVRMVLTEEQKQDIYPAATLEGNLSNSADAVYKEKDFYNIDGNYIVDISTTSLPGLPTYQNNNGTYNPNPNSQVNDNSQKLYKLNATTNKTGLGITLKVMVGDQIDIMGKSYWFKNGGNYNVQFPVPVDGIIDALLGSPTMIGKGLTTPALSPYLGGALNIFKNRTDVADAPWAYINWIFFDEQFNYAGGSFRRISSSVGMTDHTLINQSDLVAPRNGYVFVYCSNESAYDVYFDNLQVFHNKSALVEETHYYPFGLAMPGISTKAATIAPENRYKYNGIEQATDLGLNQYDAIYRNLDPQIGRWHQIDPLLELGDGITPYGFADNNPIQFNDPLGLSSQDYTGNQGYIYDPQKKQISYDPNVHKQDDIITPGLTYLGERIVTTDVNGNKTWWNEDGASTNSDPGWGNLAAVTISGVKKSKGHSGWSSLLNIGQTFMPIGLSQRLDDNFYDSYIRKGTAIDLITLGSPIIRKRFQMRGATWGTSIASILLREIIPSEYTIKGTFTKLLGTKLGERLGSAVQGRLATKGLGGAAGRVVPIIGWAIFILDLDTSVNNVLNEYIDDGNKEKFKDSPVNTNLHEVSSSSTGSL
ncbi:hypothetical protein A4D02_34265 [Niastella koreensis]|uniref:RHS repeat-associated core domain protein n=2 Tax=Niastella koreensis TaxID=354356 RepID=G8TDE1_NIAKG|nr:RHS repeat-associated core domain-containing protein [Niastella koreensis]AEV99381.1 RHS repeat-associated core domain protein [Niastella koreensis GR20-10]OQP45235.1 hypothetical protein A4D02_34265 [Niastella koreensis]